MFYRSAFKDALLSIDEEFIDFRMHLRLSRRGTFGFINRHLVVYRAAVSTSKVNSARDRVQEMYMDALCDSTLASIPATERTNAMSVMLGDVLVDALLQRRARYALHWIRKTCSAAQGRPVALLTAAVGTSMAGLLRLVRRKVGEAISGRRNRVAHER
jgi:hypothetical protein